MAYDRSHVASDEDQHRKDLNLKSAGKNDQAIRASISHPSAAHAEDAVLSSTSRDSGQSKLRQNGKRVITEDDYYDKLGYSSPWYKKWTILTVIFTVQMSMNFNSSAYASSVPSISEHFGISEQAARVGQMIFLITYAFGCELWAPWSEEYGRWAIMQLSLFLVNIWQLPCALAPNFGSLVV